MQQTLIVIPSVPMAYEDGVYFLDIKAVEGLRFYAEYWPGPILCLFRQSDRSQIAYGKEYAANDLPFSIDVITDDVSKHQDILDKGTLILASADNHHDLKIRYSTRTKVVFIIEYTLATRLRIILIDHGVNFQALKSMIWTLKTEIKRRTAIRHAAGIQANGTPAYNAYRRLNRNPMLYFDNRVHKSQQATHGLIEEKISHLARQKPLRLAFSGRLERMKGADHLVPVITALDASGMDFSFDIFGDGSLFDKMRAEVGLAQLADKVRFHGPVSFDDVLVPTLKHHIDLFVCCHRQADPSCTYIETLACGVPIIGYDNAAFAGVLGLGPVGEATPMNKPKKLANSISVMNSDRKSLANMAISCVDVSINHSLEDTVLQRINHLKIIAQL
ncbi:glycosyltransferase [Novosphingobium sp.]|uniref:glycosyltransferase n=1 Tax=Novosphingobium sp. TaxID=1874826 RepID=UPI003B52FE5A